MDSSKKPPSRVVAPQTAVSTKTKTAAKALRQDSARSMSSSSVAGRKGSKVKQGKLFTDSESSADESFPLSLPSKDQTRISGPARSISVTSDPLLDPLDPLGLVMAQPFTASDGLGSTTVKDSDSESSSEGLDIDGGIMDLPELPGTREGLTHSMKEIQKVYLGVHVIILMVS